MGRVIFTAGLWLLEGDPSDKQWKVILSQMVRLNIAVFVNEYVGVCL